MYLNIFYRELLSLKVRNNILLEKIATSVDIQVYHHALLSSLFKITSFFIVITVGKSMGTATSLHGKRKTHLSCEILLQLCSEGLFLFS